MPWWLWRELLKVSGITSSVKCTEWHGLKRCQRSAKDQSREEGDPSLTTGPAEWSAKTMTRSWRDDPQSRWAQRDAGKGDQRQEEQGGQLDSDMGLLIEASKWRCPNLHPPLPEGPTPGSKADRAPAPAPLSLLRLLLFIILLLPGSTGSSVLAWVLGLCNYLTFLDSWLHYPESGIPFCLKFTNTTSGLNYDPSYLT